MTSFRGRRCDHCRAHYTFQASGPGCGDRLNDEQHCPTCREAILKALSAIPVRYECRYIPLGELEPFSDVTQQQVEEWEIEWKQAKRSKMVGRRIWPGMINLRTNEVQEIRQVMATSGPHRGVNFRVSSWSGVEGEDHNPEFLIEVPMEWDRVEQVLGGVWSEI